MKLHAFRCIGLAMMVCVRAQLAVVSNSISDGKSLNGHCSDGLRYDESQGCIDINECTETAPCKIGQQCRNLWGSYMCVCPYGYKLDASSGDCVDRDECAMGYCGSGQRCTNTEGSFTCICSPGMVKRGRFCRDINECTQQPCDDSQHCLNTRGSYLCRCRAGYTPTADGSCVDADECAEKMCQGTGEECRNTPGSYECICREGYAKDQRTNGRYCTDVDECALNKCPQDSECINTQGSFYCRCHRGFTKYNGRCVDNQECSAGEGSKCQWRCRNLPGSYQCECPTGYNRQQFACIDRNECDNGKGVCDSNTVCVNTHGSHKCIPPITCPEGGYYRKLMSTDEFGYRQVTTNICRRRRCKRVTTDSASYQTCKGKPLSISYHYVSITPGLEVPAKLFRIKFPARRRRQQYNFSIAQGNQTVFGLQQMSMHRPHAYLMLKSELTGPGQHMVKVDMSTYDRKGRMRDNRMLTITLFVSEFNF